MSAFTTYLLVAGIILLGLALRLAGLYWGQSYGHFMYGDSLLAVERAVEFEQGVEAAQYLGQPQFNRHSKLPGPIWTLFCVAALKLGGSLAEAPLLTLLVNLMFIGLTWRLATEVLGRPYGLWAALFAATLPWPVFYSLSLYNPVVMGFVFSCFYLALWRVFTRERSAAAFWLGPILLGSVQIHMSGLMLLPASMVLLYLSPRRIHWPLLLGGVAAGLLLFLPYIRGEMANDWSNTAGMFAGGGRIKFSAFKVITSPFNVLGGLTGRMFADTRTYMAFGDAAFLSRVVLIFLTLVSTVMGVLYGLALIREARHSLRRAREGGQRWSEADPSMVFLATLVLVSLAFSFLSGRSFQSRYTIVLFPLLMMTPALFILRWLPVFRWRKWAMAGLVISIPFHLYLMPSFFAYQGRWIDESPFLAASHPQLEKLYAVVRAATPGDRRILIDAGAFQDEGKDPDRWDRQTVWIIGSICRIKDHAHGISPEAPTVTYQLLNTRHGAVVPDNVVYHAHGIALVPIDPAKTVPAGPEEANASPAPGD